jgi:cytochrome c oxidase subunit 2
VFGICVVIGVIVFGAMAYAMFKFRKSKGAVPAQFTHNIKAEIVWTTIPVLILIGLAWPATRNLIRMYDTRNAEMTVKVTGYQWMWKYEYLGEGVSYTSRLARRSDDIRQTGQSPDASVDANYLLEVDHPLVLPVGTKVRFVVTADDVIHAWWVPALGWKQDAIPGIVNEAWASIDQPGTYRGQCAELCGKDHGFMPVVVKAVPKAEFAQWLAAEKAKNAPAPAATPAPAQPAEQQPAEQPAATATTEAAPNAQAAPAAATAG